MTTKVEPEELRAAAKTIGSGATGSTSYEGKYSPATMTSCFRFGASGISATDTARALLAAVGTAQSAIEVVHARIEEWNSVLTRSAEDFENAEELSARRLAALGNFNSRPRG